MAIKFLNGVDLNQNQLIAARVENLATAPATPVEGQIYYDSTPGDQILYFWNGTSWVSTAGSGGTVTVVGATHAGNAFTASIGNNANINPSVDITVVGNSNQYINGAGNLTTFPTIPQGDITAIVAGSGMTGTSLSGPIPTLNVIGGTGITANADDIQIDYTGTDNAILSAASRSVALTDSIWFSDDTDNVIGFDTVADLLALAPQGDITGVSGGTYITVTNGSGPVPVVSHNSTTRGDSTSADSPPFGGNFEAVTSVTTNSTGHVTGIDVSTVTLPAASFTSLTLAGSSGTNSTITNGNTISILAGSNISTTGNGTDGVTIAYTGGTGTMSSWTLSGDSGPSQTISNGNTVDIAGGTYATTVASATDRVTVNVDGTTAATASKLIARDGSGYGYVITPSSGDSSTKIATTAFVQASLTGLLEFKSGFNASTGIIADGSGDDLYTDRAISVGDYYVVTVAGNFFGNTATPLTPGDSVIVQDDAAAGAAVEADFIVVQSDTDLATGTTVGLGNVAAGSGIGVVYSAGTATVSNTSPNIVQNLWSRIDADSGTTTANSPTDILDIVGGTGITTSITGDVLTITGSSTYLLPQMTATTRGGAELFSNTVQATAANSVTATSNRTYGLQLNSANQLVVNVPWVDNNTQLVSSVDETTPGTSTGTPIVVNPTTGNVLVQSMAYDGNTKVGHVPAGGTTTTFLRGDGNWVVPDNDQGVTNIIASTANSRVGLTPTTSSTGSVTIGLNLTGLTAVTTPVTTDTLPIYNASTNKKITVANLANAITDATSYAETITDTDLTIDHNLGTEDVIVQLYDVTTSANVFADITRISTNRIGVTFGSTPTNSIRVLVQKVRA
jgi:hypothetical protein